MLIKILIGLAVFAVTSIVAYLFRMRQLYTVVPKLYKTSFLSEKGSVSELIIFNRGNKTEENVTLEFDENIKCELLGANISNVKISDSLVEIDRLHAKSEASLILLVENGILSKDTINSLSSKECKGKAYKTVDEMPINSSYVAMMIIGFVVIACLFNWGPEAYNTLNNKWVSYRYTYISQQGWKNIDDYLSSDLRDSYSNQEFPFRFISYTTNDKKKTITIKYEAINKTAIPVDFRIQTEKEVTDENTSDITKWYSSKEISPLSKDTN